MTEHFGALEAWWGICRRPSGIFIRIYCDIYIDFSKKKKKWYWTSDLVISILNHLQYMIYNIFRHDQVHFCFVSASQILTEAAGVISLRHSLTATFYITICLFIVFVFDYTTFSADLGTTQREEIPAEVVWTGYTKKNNR